MKTTSRKVLDGSAKPEHRLADMDDFCGTPSHNVNSIGVWRRIRDNPQSTELRVIALTAYAMQGDRDRALAAGFDDYLTKPIDLKMLTRKIEQFIE